MIDMRSEGDDLANLDLAEELEFVCKLVSEASTIVKTFYVGAADIQYKAGDEPVTEADRSANRHIVERIQTMYPDDGLLSEESMDDLSRLNKDRVWIVDPLDGTREFIARNGEFSIMVGLSVQGRAVLGAVMQPDPGLLYAGIVGEGAFLVEEGERVPLTVSECQEPREMVFVSSRSHRQKVTDQIVRALRISRERVSGSVGLKISFISRRQADLYIHAGSGCKEWDLCAPQALLEAAGGKMTDCWGRPIRYNKEDVKAHYGFVASNGQKHGEIITVVAQACEEHGFNDDDGFW
ncbi:3'(2'),5'-bisphosphate nucleotidase CysQ [Chloroflexi bacterium TSY]|nr:3'(2'),5'-bisphosphate nucleotidase CysQ [Chloroflexi bacterium TSY]